MWDFSVYIVRIIITSRSLPLYVCMHIYNLSTEGVDGATRNMHKMITAIGHTGIGDMDAREDKGKYHSSRVRNYKGVL